MIRLATREDIPVLLTLGRQMHSEGLLRTITLDEAKVEATLLYCIGEGFLQVNEGREGVDGVLAGHIAEFWFSHEKLASDLALFVRPNRRGSIAAVRLVQAFVAWGMEKAVREICLSQSTGVRVEEFAHLLTGMGFAHVGGVFKWRLG